ncbi:hypothetical protein EX30DRAFT_393051 [Ascodesmis nigricans]|uniref:UDP-glucose:glycoprotein glucosyltransferase n=1 Tax=Ascodesmis nigricans TaxID=341454 RepID=A0A4V3SJY0_9PEZI|nr:hypothetical protein EX30DRAFT_393051 [Ascodesmis nigricans]
MWWSLHPAKLLSVALLISPFLQVATSSPAVNVGLKASWDSAPYILELIETAAAENPSSYYPLVAAISSGEFNPNSSTDQALYTEFLRVATAHGYLTKPEELSLFNLALSIHAAAPRIEAHYQYYEQNLEPRLGDDYKPECHTWIQWGSRQICDLSDNIDTLKEPKLGDTTFEDLLPFDRTSGDEGKPVAIIYISDVMDRNLKILQKEAAKGKIEYRVRYRRSKTEEGRPVILSGYGVGLALKKTDYMVMDDRDLGDGAEETGKGSIKTSETQAVLEDSESQDITPLQGKDLAGLGYKAASFIMASENPFDTLQKLSQDFPKYQAKLAAVETDEELVDELGDNWDMLFGPGVNQMFINGLQMEDSHINVFGLIEHLRGETRLIDGFKKLGLNTTEVMKLLTHETLTQAKADKTQRFDYRDVKEGGDVIFWLNDLEKDARYKDFIPRVFGLLRQVMPGSIHPVRKNIHQIVFPVDYSSQSDMMLISTQLRVYVHRKVAMRFGLVPMTTSQEAIDQAKVIYYLQDNYGLKYTLEYIDQSLVQKTWAKPSQKVFDEVVKGATGTLEGGKALSLQEVLSSEDLSNRMERAKKWGQRLGTDGPTPLILLNGQPIPKDEDWPAYMQPKLAADISLIQQATYLGELTDESSYPDWFLNDAAPRRNRHIFPEKGVDIKHINIAEVASAHKEVFKKLPKVNSNTVDRSKETNIWVVGDFDSPSGNELLTAAGEMQMHTTGANLVLINNPALLTEKPMLSTLLYHFQQVGPMTEVVFQQILLQVRSLIEKLDPRLDHVERFMEEFANFAKEETWGIPDHIEAGTFWGDARKLLASSGLKPGDRGLIVNGRVVGPIPVDEPFTFEDLQALVEYERRKRIEPVLKAAEDLGIMDKITQTDELGPAALTNQIALAGTPSVPLGFLDDPDMTRVDIRDKIALSYKHSGFTVGNKDSANIHIVVSLDPASEKAQKWVPLLNVISEMSGVYLELYLNPARTVSELPVKRFYRHVLQAKPQFDDKGFTINPRAGFENIPEKVLLSLSMDVPSSWLVTSKECIYDLDNLKIAALKDNLRGSDIEALYELRSILIEGHSSEVGGGAPQGAQLVLGTEKEPHIQDTIIMVNLGYFQLKANPGYYKINLKEGRSKEIYHIDTLGTKGQNSLADKDDKSEVALISFQGATLFPRLSRNPGMEDEKILAGDEAEEETTGALGKAVKWFKKAESLLGVGQNKANSVMNNHADINVFSVASGHLYERFLNIMMLSVMKHTDKTVKFWFIENFLSPSFKDFLPSMAKEYNFTYELVTYKWPHWLRAQKEKQREIWGYKILFLDVLFPLDLEKVIFVDADQIVRTDLKELVDLDLQGAPYGFTPMCDSRKEIEGFRFWKQGYWKTYLRGLPYHISALYVVDLKRFRQIAAGDRLRQQYHSLSADPNSLANLDQDLPNHMQSILPIHSLPQDWLWCETWCSDESLKTAKTIDLCNNPMTKEPKLDRARRQVPEWTLYDNEVARLAKRVAAERKDESGATAIEGHLVEAAKEEEDSRKKEEESSNGQKGDENDKEEKPRGHDEL